MDYRNIFNKRNSTIEWQINNKKLLEAKSEIERRQNNENKNILNNNPMSLKFKYFDGLTGSIKATSPPILVYNDAQLAITGIELLNTPIDKNNNLNKKQYFYAKLSCSGSSNRIYKTERSNEGKWEFLNFLFPADKSSELKIRLKTNFEGSKIFWPSDWGRNKKFVGEANISLLELLEGSSNDGNCRNFAFLLRPHFQQILLKCRLVPPVKQPLVETLSKLGYSDLTQNYLNNLPSSSSSSENYSSNTSSNYSFNNSKMDNKNIEKENLSSSSSNNNNLPSGWEMRVDGQGRIFYIDHIRQRTVWTPPFILEALKEVEQNNNFDEQNNFNRRTVLNSLEYSTLKNNNNIKSPKEIALNILLREDLYSRLLLSNQVANEIYNESRLLKNILQRIRKEPEKFFQFEQNRDLVNFVNSFADITQPLPSGWQLTKQKNSQMSQYFFVDHIEKNITPFDPRLNFIYFNFKQNERKDNFNKICSSAPTIRKSNQNTTENNKIKKQNHRKSLQLSQIERIVTEHYNPQLALKINNKIRLLGRLGERELLHYSNDVDIARALSLLDQLNERIPNNNNKSENEDNETNKQFLKAIGQFHAALKNAGYANGQNKLRFRLRRDHLMEDAYQKILCLNSSQLRTYQMMVNFAEEDGLDYGGPSRELFFLLSKQLFNPKNGLFEYSCINSYKIQISPMSKFIDNYLRWMELCGRVLGLALVHRCLLDCFFTKPFYKIILAKIPLVLDDLLETDKELYYSLNWLHKNSTNIENLELTFCVTEELAGEIFDYELLPNGKNINVNNENKNQFIELLLSWRVERGVRDQFKALLFGLNTVIDHSILNIFNSDQLELAISGNIFIDINDWEKNTVYRGEYRDNHIVIRWFWQCVHEMCNSDRLKLLQFVTGSASVPFEGFKGLRGSNGSKPFCIERWGNEENLPRAHTCFNRLDLPLYSNKQKMFKKLILAINESSSYAIE